jgi:hypothetical protein
MRTLIPLGVLALLATGVAAGPPTPAVPGLRDPVPAVADGEPVVRATLFPFVADLDGDGKPDLLLGTHTKGRMLLARNTGKPGAMAFGPPQWFDELNPDVTIPAG